jgi:hypothetical protein
MFLLEYYTIHVTDLLRYVLKNVKDLVMAGISEEKLKKPT